MHRETVSSSGIASTGYDPSSETLEIEFKSGTIYQYYDVEKYVYDQLMAAPSKGRFLNYEIKDAFPYSRV
jgi:hypothetical protein